MTKQTKAKFVPGHCTRPKSGIEHVSEVMGKGLAKQYLDGLKARKRCKPTKAQKAIFGQYFAIDPAPARKLAFVVADHVWQLAQAKQYGVTDEQLAKALGAPVEYIEALRAAGEQDG